MCTFASICMGCLSFSQAEIIPFEPDLGNAIAGIKKWLCTTFSVFFSFIKTPFLFNPMMMK